MKAWLASDSAKRVGRTLVQVFGGVAIAALLDWGEDGQIVIRNYVFGPGGVIIAATGFLAALMNRSVPPTP